MTLSEPNIERMLQIGLSGMAEALAEQRDVAHVEQLGFGGQAVTLRSTLMVNQSMEG